MTEFPKSDKEVLCSVFDTVLALMISEECQGKYKGQK